MIYYYFSTQIFYYETKGKVNGQSSLFFSCDERYTKHVLRIESGAIIPRFQMKIIGIIKDCAIE